MPRGWGEGGRAKVNRPLKPVSQAGNRVVLTAPRIKSAAVAFVFGKK